MKTKLIIFVDFRRSKTWKTLKLILKLLSKNCEIDFVLKHNDWFTNWIIKLSCCKKKKSSYLKSNLFIYSCDLRWSDLVWNRNCYFQYKNDVDWVVEWKVCSFHDQHDFATTNSWTDVINFMSNKTTQTE